ncbi:MAG: SDR family oxidoreductase [Porticoccaceae bacterium]|nr:SDR family oxidoreductase [Pseudomonadales bacterium]MCP5172941.1 SDR family oxidoreductase [Pseudomonadales bacterium]MCP5302414.1 SDR family oxidoreductase [Pseudomonadales bacterium]
MSNIENLFSMKGKIALVTGAASGMGERFAHTLADAGATVICAARRADRIDSVAASINEAGGKAIAIPLDIGSEASVKAVFDRIENEVGRVNVLVNAAAQLDFGLFPEVNNESWDNLLNVNLSGTMRMCREFSERLIKAGETGNIVNITSVTGMQVMTGVPVYGTIKAAVNHLTRSMARDMFDKGIRCNAIAPGYFQTDMVSGYFETEEGKADIDRLPLKRPGQVHELDGAILLLASDAGSFINGAILPVDSGQVLQLV